MVIIINLILITKYKLIKLVIEEVLILIMIKLKICKCKELIQIVN